MISEILIKDDEIRLARVLLKFNLPIKKYPDFGTWCYLINAGEEIVIFDTGASYYSSLPIINYRKYSRKTNNIKLVLHALQKYFPKKAVREIILSHYHFDHSEIAPKIQKKIKEKFGNIPPIRLHKNDLGKKKFARLLSEDLESIFRLSENFSWVLGKPVQDNELIKGTEFYIKHLPGHTTGTVGLINDKYKVMICGWWLIEKQSFLVKLANHIINEDNAQLKRTIEFLKTKNYKQYHYHPIIS